MKFKAFPAVTLLGTLAVVFVGCVIQNRPADSTPAATATPAATNTAAPTATATATAAPTATATATPSVTATATATATAPTGKVMTKPKAEAVDGGASP